MNLDKVKYWMSQADLWHQTFNDDLLDGQTEHLEKDVYAMQVFLNLAHAEFEKD